jgi:hypothetical protein
MIATYDVSPDIRIHGIVNQMIECSIEDLLVNCPDLSWNQIFAAVDRLSRAGSVRLQQKGRESYGGPGWNEQPRAGQPALWRRENESRLNTNGRKAHNTTTYREYKSG